MHLLHPFHFTFHCECKIRDINDRESTVRYTLDTNIRLGELFFLNKLYLQHKYNKIIEDMIKKDDNIKDYEIIKSDFVLDLR